MTFASSSSHRTAVVAAERTPLELDESAVIEYWDERSTTYSCAVCEEIEGDLYHEWDQILRQRTADVRGVAARQERIPRVLDLGCGPGFFEILFARMDCAVDAVDVSAGMIEQARRNNAQAGTLDRVRFHEGDVSRLPFQDDQFDIVVLRNVTWLMRDPLAAYEEWRRVLIPGGKLLVFDANWYRYLASPAANAQRIIDEASSFVSRSDVNGSASDDQEMRCEQIALSLPFTYIDRPQWDVAALEQLGFVGTLVDDQVWKRVWTEGEQSFYGSSPLFMVEATK